MGCLGFEARRSENQVQQTDYPCHKAASGRMQHKKYDVPAVGPRSNITHSVIALTRSMSKPGPRAMSKLKRVLRYLKGMALIEITYIEDVDDGD